MYDNTTYRLMRQLPAVPEEFPSSIQVPVKVELTSGVLVMDPLVTTVQVALLLEEAVDGTKLNDTETIATKIVDRTILLA